MIKSFRMELLFLIEIIFSTSDNIINVSCEGILTINDFLNYHDKLSKITPSIRILRILAHFHNVSFSFTTNETQIISKNIKNTIDFNKNVKYAALTDQPIVNAYALIYLKYAEDISNNYKLFYTKEAALNWLNEI